MGYLLTATGTLVLIHAAYSCLHYRSLLQDLEDSLVETPVTALLDSTSSSTQQQQQHERIPPTDVWIEVIAGFLILLLAELTRSALVPVSNDTKSKVKKRPIMAPAYRSRDFDIYAHRCKSL